jgi:hypothetical protein
MLTTEIFDARDVKLKILSFIEDIKYHLGAKQNSLLGFQLYADLGSFYF